MPNKFTKREKRLIFVLINICILTVGFRFFLLPSWNQYNDAKSQKEQVRTEYLMEKEQAAQADVLSKRLAEMQANGTGSGNDTLPFMTPESIHRFFTDISTANKLNCFDMKISDYEQTHLLTEAEKQSLKDNSSLKDTLGIPIYQVSVELRFNGTQAGYENFLETLSQKNNVSVESFQIVSSEQDQTLGTKFVYAQNILDVKAVVLMSHLE